MSKNGNVSNGKNGIESQAQKLIEKFKKGEITLEKLPKKFKNKVQIASAEEEKLIDFHFIKAVYDPAKKFLHFNPFILLSRDHFHALLQGARNGKL